MNQWGVAPLWTALALAAGLISVRTAISVSLVEIAVGVVGGNYLGLHTTDWTNSLAGFGAILLTFLTIRCALWAGEPGSEGQQRSRALWRSEKMFDKILVANDGSAAL